jgi:hypothetical protein
VSRHIVMQQQPAVVLELHISGMVHVCMHACMQTFHHS